MLHVKRSERGFDEPVVGGTGDRCWLTVSRLSLVGLHINNNTNAHFLHSPYTKHHQPFQFTYTTDWNKIITVANKPRMIRWKSAK